MNSLPLVQQQRLVPFKQRPYATPLASTETIIQYNPYRLKFRLQLVATSKDMYMGWSVVVCMDDDIVAMSLPVKDGNHNCSIFLKR